MTDISKKVIDIMRTRFGHPWTNRPKDRAAVARFLASGDPADLPVLWQHAARTIQMVYDAEVKNDERTP